MNLSLIDKVGLIFKYIFSSFIPCGLLIIFILLLTLIILNLKYKNKTFNVVVVGIFIGTLLGIILSHSDYISYCVKSFFKLFVNYFYFPSPVIYFFIILFMIGVSVNSIFSDKISFIKKIFNYIMSILTYFLFFLFVVRVTMNGVVLMDMVSVYSDEVILSIIQISNVLFVFWVVVTLFNKLYLFYKKKFD